MKLGDKIKAFDNKKLTQQIIILYSIVLLLLFDRLLN